MRTAPLVREHVVMITASGARLGWSELPAHVHAAVANILGAPVVSARSQPGGFSPGSADRVVTSAGRRAFVKVVGAAQNERSIELHRQEASVVAALSASVPAPRLLGVHDDGDWVALVFDDDNGRHPRTPWIETEIEAVLAALALVAATPAGDALPNLSEALATDLAGWHRLAAATPAELDPWAVAHLDVLCELAARAAALLDGAQLVHGDVRADNLLIRPDGAAVLVDWPWAARGSALFDPLTVLVNVQLYGGHDVDALARRHLQADPDEITAVLAALAGYFLDGARLPAPRGLPTLRAFQAAQGASTLAWVRQRIEG